MKLVTLLNEIQTSDKIINFLKKKLIGDVRTINERPFNDNPLRYRIENVIYDYVYAKPKPYNTITLRVVLLDDEGLKIRKREISNKWKNAKKYYGSKNNLFDFTQSLEGLIARPFDHYLELLGIEEGFCYVEIMND
jgi:hypothetical protein